MRTLLVRVVLAASLGLALPSFAQQTPLQNPDRIWTAFADQSTRTVNGFRNGLSGETIDYHSANEFARNALLVRPTDGTRYIEWQTDPTHTAADRSTVTFAWLAGLCASRGVHKFDMSIDGEPWFVFSSGRDSNWTVAGKGGSSLSFFATEADRFTDQFGYMFLKMPASLLADNHPLTIRVTGQAEGSDTWYMTFQYPLVERTMMEPLPVLVQESDTVCQLIKVTVEHYSAPATLSVFVDPARTVSRQLTWGLSTILLPTKAVSAAQRKTASAEIDGNVVARDTLTIRPVTPRQLYLLPHSHTDIGYSAYQADVEKSHIRYLDDAIAIARRTSSYPPGAQFRWNIEVLWPLESYLDRATAAQKQDFIEAVHKGWIGLNGLYANMLTGLCRPEELLHFTDFARRLSKQYGFVVNSAMITDIPAYTSGTVTALAASGIKYWSSGPNYVPSLPDLGDRIGHALRALGDQPFYWESESGQSRVLFWMAGKGYSWFHGWIMGRLKQSNTAAIFRYLDDLDSLNYPYATVQLRYTVDGDNGPPDAELPDFVKEWNAAHISPKFVIATTEELFAEFERRYGKELPVRRGDLTPYWEDGAASTARELTLNRSSAEKLVQAEALYGMLDPGKYSVQDFYGAWRDVVLFDEHTWGAWNSISEPDSPSVKAQWAYKQKFALDGRDKADNILERITNMNRPGPKPLSSLLIANTNSWPRTDLIVLPKDLPLAGSAVKTGDGTPLPSQRLSTGELAILVRDVPPMGTRRIVIERGKPHRIPGTLRISGNTMSNGLLRLSVSAKNGAVDHLIRLSDGMELVDSMRGRGLNEYLYVAGNDPRNAVGDSSVTVSVGEKGPLVASLVVASRPAGSRSLRREIRMIGGVDRVEFVDVVDKEKVRSKESVHIGFPFLVPQGTMRMDEGWESIRPETDQMAGSCKDFFSIQRWVDVSNERYGVTWATIDAPLVEVGALTDESETNNGVRAWRDSVAPGRNFYSYAMNNYWHTNYKADQEGEVTFRYAARSHGAFDEAEAVRFGAEMSQPLIVVNPASGAARSSSLFSVSPAGVLVTSFKPADDGQGWVVRLLNCMPGQQSCSIQWRGNSAVNFYRSSLTEDRGSQITFPMTMSPHAVVTLKIVPE